MQEPVVWTGLFLVVCACHIHQLSCIFEFRFRYKPTFINLSSESQEIIADMQNKDSP